MRRTVMLSLAVPVVLGLTLAGEDTPGPGPAPDLTPEPHPVNIVGVCAGGEPRVVPPRVTVNGVDEVLWREPADRAESITIEPKEPGAWPFARSSHAAGRGQAAASGRPAERTVGGQPVQEGQVYSYKVTIVCPGGETQVIDPDIVIGEI